MRRSSKLFVALAVLGVSLVAFTGTALAAKSSGLPKLTFASTSQTSILKGGKGTKPSNAGWDIAVKRRRARPTRGQGTAARSR